MKQLTLACMFFGLSLLAGRTARAQGQSGVDPNALIERILTVDSAQRARINDVTFDAELIVGEMKKDGFVEKERYLKKVYVKYLPDTTLFHETYLEYFKEGVKQSDKERVKKARERKEKARKRHARNIAYPMLRPFQPQYRQDYDIAYKGVMDARVEGYICYRFDVTSRVKDAEHINGTYYFEADGFHLVKCDFSPAKLTKNLMFKMKKLEMTIIYGPAGDNYWLPKQFDLFGKGKAAFLFGVNFAATEYYRNPVINTGLNAGLFKEESHD
ncbi:MAG: hypothetical protein D6800_02305 [Candidatus Zixiibacteriota bacterium]|nr:MAG: hypothetical protein D6800_02305 [candidate division Zixibacteria bacterium]